LTPKPAAGRRFVKLKSLAFRKMLPASRNVTTANRFTVSMRSSALSTTSPLPPFGKPVCGSTVSAVPRRSSEKPRTVVSPPAKKRSLAGRSCTV